MMLDPILLMIGGAFLALTTLIVVLAKVLCSPRFASAFAGGSNTHDEGWNTWSSDSSAFSELDSFVSDDDSDSSSDSDSSD